MKTQYLAIVYDGNKTYGALVTFDNQQDHDNAVAQEAIEYLIDGALPDDHIINWVFGPLPRGVQVPPSLNPLEQEYWSVSGLKGPAYVEIPL